MNKLGLKESIYEDLKFQLELYTSYDGECDGENSIDREYGPLFGYIGIRDFLTDKMAPEIKDEKILALINELDKIINGDDKRFDNSYVSTLDAVDRCDDIIDEIKNIIEEYEDEDNEEDDDFVYDVAMFEPNSQI